MLENYVEVPRATSLLNLKYIATPTRKRSSSFEDHNSSDCEADEQDEEEFKYMIEELYKRSSRYELDINEYEIPRQQMIEYVAYRRRFEQST